MSDEGEQVPTLLEPRNPFIFVDSRELLASAVTDLTAASGPFAVDAERASGFKYSQRAYLVQIYRAGSSIYLIDPAALLANNDLSVFSNLSTLMDTDEWVLHAATQDLPCLAELGLRPYRLFDTELGSRLAGLPRVGLGAVTEQLLGIRLAKEHSAVDWSTRPMPSTWLNYAALDVDVLLDLRAAVAENLAEQDKSEYAHQEFEHVTRFTPKPAKLDRWRGATGLHEVKDARSMAVARELWTAREDLGQKLDVSPSRLIPDSSIVAVAKSTPKTKPELAGFKAFAGRASRTYLDTWWKAIQQGATTLDLPALRLPATGIPNHRIWGQRFPAADARLKLAKLAISKLSEELSIPMENLLTPDYLRSICFEPPESNALPEIGKRLLNLGARPWQISLTAGLLLDAFDQALKIEVGVSDESEPKEDEVTI